MFRVQQLVSQVLDHVNQMNVAPLSLSMMKLVMLEEDVVHGRFRRMLVELQVFSHQLFNVNELLVLRVLLAMLQVLFVNVNLMSELKLVKLVNVMLEVNVLVLMP